jgi:hypothetical protein
LKPDDEALISIFYYLGFTHGMRYSLRKLEPNPCCRGGISAGLA